MNQQFFVSLLLICATLGPALQAQEIQEEHPIDVSVSVDYVSKYVADGIVFLDKPAVQTDVCFTFTNGMYFDVWWSAGLDDSNLSSNFGDEIDYTIGWSGPTNFERLGNPAVNIALSYYDLVDLGNFEEDIVKISGELSWEVPILDQEIQPFVNIEYYIPIDWPGVEGGVKANLGVSHSYMFFPRLSFNHSAQILYDDGVAGFKDGFLMEYSASILWKYDPFVVKPFGIDVSTPISGMEFRETEVVFGFGASVSF